MLSNSDIQKLLSVLASKEDLSEVKEEVKRVEDRLSKRLDRVETGLEDLNEKVDIIVEFTHEVDDDTSRRLKRVAKQLNLPSLQT